ncbi:MAG: hypothetical protein WD335_01155 [Candidatus Paceibacterota bacterium]
MYVEIIGAEGAGKTTVSLRVKEILIEEGTDCAFMESLFSRRSLLSKFFRALYLLRFFKFSMLRIFSIRKSSKPKYQTSFKKNVKDIYLYLSMRHHISSIESKSKEGVVLSDHSILIRLATLVCKSVIREEEAVNIALGLIPQKTLFIYMNTPPADIMDRHKERGRDSKLVQDLKDREEKLSELKKYNEVIDNILEKICYTRDDHCVTLDGRVTVETNAHDIVQKVTDLLKQ